MEMLIMCDICLKYFNNARRPRVLNCGHSFCTPCLFSIVKYGRSSCYCPLCHASITFTCFDWIPHNLTLESFVPLVKEYLGTECNSKKLKKRNEKEALQELCKKVIDKEVREKLEKEVEERISKSVKEENTKIMKLKMKLENKNKEKIKRLEASKALLREELNNLKRLRKEDRSEVSQLRRENKRLQSQKVAQRRSINIQSQRNNERQR